MGNILHETAPLVNTTKEKKHDIEERKILVYRKPSISVYKYGMIARAGIANEICLANLKHGRKAGTHFSRAARRRLRAFVISHDIPDCSLYGITFTLPPSCDIDFQQGPNFVGPPSPFVKPLLDGGVPAEFSATLNRFGLYFHRKFPQSGLVYRVELQMRGVPHIHCVAYIAHADHDARIDAPPTIRGFKALERKLNQPLRYSLIDIWSRAVRQTCFVGSAESFKKWQDDMACHRGFDCRPVENHQRLLRYILDDASKHKQEQLGYDGKSWAVVARKNFIETKIFETSENREMARLARIGGMIRRYKILDERAPFGWRHSKYHPADRGGSVVQAATAERLVCCVTTSFKSNYAAKSPNASDKKAGLADRHGLPPTIQPEDFLTLPIDDFIAKLGGATPLAVEPTHGLPPCAEDRARRTAKGEYLDMYSQKKTQQHNFTMKHDCMTDGKTDGLATMQG